MKRGKYLNIKTEVDGIKFASKREAEYYLILKDKKMHGKIVYFRTQVPYELIPTQWSGTGKDRICLERSVKYIADFVVTELNGQETVIDTKGKRTQSYVIKRKLMLYRAL